VGVAGMLGKDFIFSLKKKYGGFICACLPAGRRKDKNPTRHISFVLIKL
jgi:hypothetical protein